MSALPHFSCPQVRFASSQAWVTMSTSATDAARPATGEQKQNNHTVVNKVKDTFPNPLWSPVECSVSSRHIRQCWTDGYSVVVSLCSTSLPKMQQCSTEGTTSGEEKKTQRGSQDHGGQPPAINRDSRYNLPAIFMESHDD